MTTRLTQLGIGGRDYDTPIEVELNKVNWGWQAHPISVEHETPAVSRLSQMAISAKAYETEVVNVIGLTKAYWGWTTHPLTVEFSDPIQVDLTHVNWGWAGQKLTICSQSDWGYYGSFNDHVWPTCSFNDHVFGPRTHLNLEVGGKNWGWQTYSLNISFTDPVDVDLTHAQWGWTALPLSVSYGYDVQLQTNAWGWQSFPISVEMPYDVDLVKADWGWRTYPLGVSYQTDIQLGAVAWGWQTYPITVDAPTYDISLQKVNYGWQTHPITVRQTSLMPGDIEAIADAVYQKFLDEGILDQIAWVFQRAAGDPTYPQTFHTREDGHTIEMGPHTISQVTDSKGNVTQTRQS